MGALHLILSLIYQSSLNDALTMDDTHRLSELADTDHTGIDERRSSYSLRVVNSPSSDKHTYEMSESSMTTNYFSVPERSHVFFLLFLSVTFISTFVYFSRSAETRRRKKKVAASPTVRFILSLSLSLSSFGCEYISIT
jgi:hypothetical protein